MLVRHAEKPKSPPPYGVTADGARSDDSLVVRGWQRAGFLVPYFRTPWAPGIVTPGTIFAAGSGKQLISKAGDEDDGSVRPQETAAPLAAALGIAVATGYGVGQEAALATAVLRCDGDVLVVWEHKHIPKLAAAFSDAAPATWPGSAFDLVWLLRASKRGYDFEELQQGF